MRLTGLAHVLNIRSKGVKEENSCENEDEVCLHPWPPRVATQKLSELLEQQVNSGSSSKRTKPRPGACGDLRAFLQVVRPSNKFSWSCK